MPAIVVKKDETRMVPILWSGAESELEYTVTLAEPGASVTFLAVLMGRNTDSLNLIVTVIHSAPNTTSEVVIRGALSGGAKVSVIGLVKIEKGAVQTKAWLAAHLLLLSENAKGVAVPSLEILENDIKAGHATTVGRVSETELFYLMSRGLPMKTARQLIVNGFLQNLIDRFPEDLALQARSQVAELEL